jgi:hypothetical protein
VIFWSDTVARSSLIADVTGDSVSGPVHFVELHKLSPRHRPPNPRSDIPIEDNIITSVYDIHTRRNVIEGIVADSQIARTFHGDADTIAIWTTRSNLIIRYPNVINPNGDTGTIGVGDSETGDSLSRRGGNRSRGGEGTDGWTGAAGGLSGDEWGHVSRPENQQTEKNKDRRQS